MTRPTGGGPTGKTGGASAADPRDVMLNLRQLQQARRDV
jgi:hypothetical protein